MENLRTLLIVAVAATLPLANGLSQRPSAGDPGPHASASTVLPEILLWPHGAPGARGDGTEDRPSITPYLAAPASATRTAAIVFPGGGYTHLATEKEGTAVAEWLNTLGVSAFVVRYRLGPRYRHPAMLEDAQRAVRLVRSRAAEWQLDAHRVGVVGFSAGGHMASTAGTHFDASSSGDDPIDSISSRPDFMVLLYPVVTMAAPFAHRGSRLNLLGDNPPDELVRLMSNERQVTANTPPTFLATTTDDATVPVENSLMFYEALRAASVPVELHVFESGRHGFGLGGADPVLRTWTDQCAAWLRRHGWLSKST